MPAALSSPPAILPPMRAHAARIGWSFLRTFLWPLATKKLPALRCILLRACGARTTLRSQLAASCHIESPWLFAMGEYCAIDRRVLIENAGGVEIGNRTVISQDAHLCTLQPDQPPSPITVGSDVWIAAGAFIGPGVTIGDGAVVGAYAVVHENVAPWTVVAGDPLRVIKPRILQGTVT